MWRLVRSERAHAELERGRYWAKPATPSLMARYANGVRREAAAASVSGGGRGPLNFCTRKRAAIDDDLVVHRSEPGYPLDRLNVGELER